MKKTECICYKHKLRIQPQSKSIKCNEEQITPYSPLLLSTPWLHFLLPKPLLTPSSAGLLLLVGALLPLALLPAVLKLFALVVSLELLLTSSTASPLTLHLLIVLLAPLLALLLLPPREPFLVLALVLAPFQLLVGLGFCCAQGTQHQQSSQQHNGQRELQTSKPHFL